MIDTHAHVNFEAYKDDADEVIRRSLDSDTWIINVGSQYSTSKRAIELAEKYGKGVYAAIGLHSIYARDGFDYKKYERLTQSPKVVAIGEIGLDHKEEYASFKKEQKEIFLKQLELAKELHLPIIFHCRMAHKDLIETLNKWKAAGSEQLKGVVHCFTGTWNQAEKYLAMGLYLGFNGIIFKMNLDDIIEKTPLDKILIETDCPYLTPPSAGVKRNEPIYVRYIAEKIAQIKSIGYEEISKITTENAKKLFKI
ncbi:MAG TPA: TatD family hydrolase [Candidatus Humimicrobiaceae bacterium]|nr:TatD family hydrolase [Candidatus Humimicrobiaceae bacterium]